MTSSRVNVNPNGVCPLDGVGGSAVGRPPLPILKLSRKSGSSIGPAWRSLTTSALPLWLNSTCAGAPAG
jgi:hypothetical protein